MGNMRQTQVPAVMSGLLAVLALLVSATVMAQERSGTSAASLSEEGLEERSERPQEMTIRGQRLFRHLHQEIHKAEDRMYGLFNELNGDELLNIHCQWHAELGTRIRQRSCQPEFVRQALEGQAKDFTMAVQGSAYSSGHPPAAAIVGHYNPILEKRLKEVVQESPEFLEAIQHHHALREELQRRKRMFFNEE